MCNVQNVESFRPVSKPPFSNDKNYEFTIACCLYRVGLRLELDLVFRWLVVMQTYLYYFPLSLSLPPRIHITLHNVTKREEGRGMRSVPCSGLQRNLATFSAFYIR